MKYRGTENFSHDRRAKIGVLLTNLGTPDAPDTPSLRRYLAEFLADPRVVEFPRFLWRIILHGIILRIRPSRSAKAYKTVWTEQGSPLAIYTKAQAEGVERRLQSKYGDDIEVAWAMRYGQPSVHSGIEALMSKGVQKMVVLPLYPQYSGSTTASTFDALAKDFTQRRWIPELRFINCYHDNPDYITALVNKIKQYRAEHEAADKLIFSYHGIPKRYLDNGDPYHCHCYKTTRLVAEALDLSSDQYMTTFQSRFGREEWLQPYTDETMKALPGMGVKSVQVVCPGFSSDCLETIEEIGEESREYFEEAGGEQFGYIPCLNDDDAHLDALTTLIETNLHGWSAQPQEEADLAQKLARDLGASA